MSWQAETALAIAAVQTAMALCEQVRQDSQLLAIAKADRSPVTVADFGAQALICQALSQAFPQMAIVAEESADLLRSPAAQPQRQQVTAQVQRFLPNATESKVLDWIDRGTDAVDSTYWTLDPIDGTKGFLRGGQYAVALALIQRGEVQLGVIGCPRLPVDWRSTAPDDTDRGVIFVAERGQTARSIASPVLSPSRRSPFSPAQISASPALQLVDPQPRLIESVEAGHGNPELQRSIALQAGLTAPPLQMDSLAKYGAVARGEAAAYMRLPWVERPDYRENVWDHAAGILLIETAGGTVTDMQGRSIDFSVGKQLVNNQGIVASTAELQPKLIQLLQQACP